jgi:hypothetical protein
MRRHVLGMIGRVVVVFIGMGVFIYTFPEPWVRTMAPVVKVMTVSTFPYVTELTVTAEGRSLQINGNITLGMTLRDGAALPSAPGTWTKGTGATLNLLILAAAVFAAPSVGWRSRLLGFPVMLAGVLLVGAYHLTVEIQESALTFIGYQWLPSMPLAGTEENLAIFKLMESRFRVLVWIKSFNDAGGALFLAIMAGLISHTITGAFRTPPTGSPQNR